MSKIKIAFFLDVMLEDFDGVSITMHQVIKRMPRGLFDAIFITPQPPVGDIGFPVHVCPSIKLPENDKEYLVAIPKRMKNINELLDAFDPDILHFSSPTPLGNFATKYAARKNKPVVSIYHTHYPSFASYYLKYIPSVEKLLTPVFKFLYRMYYRTDVVFAPTASMKKFLLGIGVKESNITIWGRGVDTDRFNPSRRIDNLWSEIPKNNKKVIFVSRLVKEKEPQTLIRIYKLLEKLRKDISMIVVGEGPTKELLQKNMPKALFTGKLTGEDLANAYASSDVFVFPSTTETFGNVVLEALASGLPVVAANAGGPSDIVKDGETGYLVKPQDEQAFYSMLVKLLDDPIHYKETKQAALAYANSQNWENLSSQLYSHYSNIFSKHQDQ